MALHIFNNMVCIKAISNGIFKFNFLALVDSEIIGSPKFKFGAP